MVTKESAGVATLIGSPACDGAAPPTCCQPEPMDDARWAPVLAERRAQDAVLAARIGQPSSCSACGSTDLLPLFEPLAGFQCSDHGCHAILTGKD